MGTPREWPDEHGLFTHTIKLTRDSFQIADFSKYRIDTYALPTFNLVSQNKILNERKERALRQIPQRLLSDGHYYFYDVFIQHELYLSKWKNGEDPEEIYDFGEYKKMLNTRATRAS